MSSSDLDSSESGVIGTVSKDAGVASLDDSLNAESIVERVGAKAANLVAARRAGLPVLPGIVLTTSATKVFADPSHPDHDRIVENWLARTNNLASQFGGRLVVRSSSPLEDGVSESRAGFYTSVVDVSGDEAVGSATIEVIDSAGRDEIAVLAQPLVEPLVSGVLFGIDPVSGDENRLLIAAVNGLPEGLVSGETTASQYHVSRRGRIVGVEHAPDTGPIVLGRTTVRRLARLAQAVARQFNSPQDVEWAIDRNEKLWLLQSRPVTTRVSKPAGAAVFGTRGVDETFPDALSPLESDLWIPPLAGGIRNTLNLLRIASRRTIAESPIATTVGGWVVADQLLLGNMPARKHWFDPRPGYRRLSVAWHVGRLRGALVPLATQALIRTDHSLLTLPGLSGLGDEELLGVIDRAADGLNALHGMEILAGMLLPPRSSEIQVPTGAGAAAALQSRLRSRPNANQLHGADFMSDDELVKVHPLLFALVPPRIGGPISLPIAAPDDQDSVAASEPSPTPANQVELARESLRLRARWLQEVQARVVAELAARLHRDGLLVDPMLVRNMRLSELRLAVRAGTVPGDLEEREIQVQSANAVSGLFRLSQSGTPIGFTPKRAKRRYRHNSLPNSDEGGISGQGGGGGRGRGRVVQDPSLVVFGDVLVLGTLDPRFATLVPGLAGIVSESGSPLSHLSIVAREHGVPIVVGVTSARQLLPPGTDVIVDGNAGQIRIVDEPTDPKLQGSIENDQATI